MNLQYKLRDVFSRGMPTVTYVAREHLNLEKKLRQSIAKGHAIVAVTGPSKSGKTVLRRTVVPDSKCIRIEGGHISTEVDFWETIRTHLGSSNSFSQNETSQQGSSSQLSFQLGNSTAKLTAGATHSTTESTSETANYSGPQKNDLLSIARKKNLTIAIDDFHHIKKDIRASIVRSLKSAIFDGLSVVILSVPYRAFDVLGAEAEMEGRFTHLSIPTWSEEDLCLKQIKDLQRWVLTLIQK